MTKHTAWLVVPFRSCCFCGRWGGAAGSWGNFWNCADVQRGPSILLCLPPPAAAQGMALCPHPRSAFLFLLRSFQASAISTHYARREAGPRLRCAPRKHSSSVRTMCPSPLLVPLDGHLKKQQSFFKAQLTCHLLSKAFSHSLRQLPTPSCHPPQLFVSKCCHCGNFHSALRLLGMEVTF